MRMVGPGAVDGALSTDSVERRRAGVAPDRVMRELELVVPADEHAERALAVARGSGRPGEPPGQQHDSRIELLVRALTRHRGGDVVAVDAERKQPLLDALGAPAVEPPAILGEALGEAC